ncbi:MAG: hypothetical protein ACI8W3_001629 [Myxococcota bacterium]
MRSNRIVIMLGLGLLALFVLATVANGANSPVGAAAVDAIAVTEISDPPLGDVGAEPISAANLTFADAKTYRSEIEKAWFQDPNGGVSSGAANARMTALALGIDNLDAAARALIAPGDPDNALGNAMLAVRLAPDLPLAHMALAREMWSERDRTGAIREAGAGVVAIFRNFEALAWLVGSVLVMIAIVMVVAPLVFIVSVAVSVYGRASHDLGDMITSQMPTFARAALLGALVLIPLALGEGIIGLVVGLFAIGFVYGSSRHRMALSLAVVFFLMGMYPVAHTARTALIALDSDPVASATLAVLQGEESQADIALLERASETEFLAMHVLAIRARRLGNLDEALERYADLMESHPRNANVLTNYANLRFMTGDDEGAVDLYERSAALVDSARIMFNLSQVNARLFRIEEFEATLRAAQAIDADMVAHLSGGGEAGFVSDLAFPLLSLRSRLLAAAQEQATPRLAIDFIMPGWLGQSWMHVAGVFGLLVLLGGMLSSRFEQASACTRCGQRICTRCDGTVWNSETCNGCYHLFHRPETTDPVLRMKRLYELQARDTRIGRVALACSVLLPGVGGLLARRPDLSLLGTVAAAFSAVFLLWHNGVVPDPLAVGAAGSLAFVAAGGFAMVIYFVIVGTGLSIRRNL